MILQDISRRLISSGTPDGWPVTRSFLTDRSDDQAFITANILSILDRCRVEDPALRSRMDDARPGLSRCAYGHRAWHYPPYRGHCPMPGLPFITLSADADCTCLYHLASGVPEDAERVCADLSHFRIEGRHFRPARFQAGLPDIHGSFLTWFPERISGKGPRTETVDLGVDANILWYLGTRNRLDIPGARETVRFIRSVLGSDIILADPWRVSMYYPFPAVLLYLISRSAVWGNVPELFGLRERILSLSHAIIPATALDHLLLASVGKYWQDTLLSDKHQEAYITMESGTAPFYVAPLLGWLALRWAPALALARRPMTHISYSCRSLELALAFWLVRNG